MTNVRQLFARLWNSSVVWLWGFNGLRLASGLLLLPLLVKLLPTERDLGMYYVFLNIAAVVPMIDFGFTGSIGRAVCCALGGATEIVAYGVAPAPGPDSRPNYELLWRLLHTTRRLYAYLSLGALLLVGVCGTVVVEMRAHETSSPALTRIAWAVALTSVIWEIYASWWSSFLYAMNHVLTHARLNLLAHVVKFLIAAGLLLSGAGLLSVPLAGLVSGLVQRYLARFFVRRHLARTGIAAPCVTREEVRDLFARLWPNSWRQGVISLSNYFSTNANSFVCATVFGLAATAQYGLSLQIMSISQGVAFVWTQVKWPQVGVLRARHDSAGIRRLIWPRMWLQNVTFLALATLGILCGPLLLQWWGSQKTLLPTPWLIVAAVCGFLDMQLSFWTALLTTENRIPFLRPVVISNGFSLCLALYLVAFSSLEAPALILAPLLAGCLFNYWYWPPAGARSMQTHWFRFMFASPRWEAAARAN